MEFGRAKTFLAGGFFGALGSLFTDGDSASLSSGAYFMLGES